MRPISLFAALLALTSVTVPTCADAAGGHSGTFYVGPGGRDDADGTKEQPFATIDKARDASRTIPSGQPKRIVVLEGKYHGVSVVFGPEDSGLTVEAAPGAKPILYGGVPLQNWVQESGGFFAAGLPPGHDWQPRMLEADGRICPRARYPAQGTFAHLSAFDVPWLSSTAGGWKRKPTSEELTTLKYRPADIGPWLDVQSAEITVYHMWDESSVGISANDPEAGVLTLTPACGHPPGAFGVKKYVLWNIREGLTAPGKWYHDRPRNRIVYWPLPGQDMRKAAVIVPTAFSIIRLAGTAKEKIKNVTLRGLALSVTTVPLVSAGFAAEKFEGALSLANAENCLLSGLTIARVAGHGINARGSVAGIRVENCEVGSCGAGGVYVGGTGGVITNNHIHDVGLFYPSAIGIYRGGSRNTVSHNEVHGCSYSGINYGGRENIVEDNLVYDCMKALHDGAAIYMFGAKNCVIRRNLVRDILDGGGYGASAFYLDEQSEGCTVEKNLSLRAGWPSHNHMARKNTIRNNVFLADGDARITFARSSDYSFERNVLWAAGSITIKNPEAVTAWSENVFFSGQGRIEQVRLKDYATVETIPGAPAGTAVGDPLFVDMEKGDYRYRRDSPAVKLGLEPVDVSRAGLLPK